MNLAAGTLPLATQKTVTILGSTGSIGLSTLKVLEQHPEAYRLLAITAQNNVSALAQQARHFKPEMAVIGNTLLYDELKDALAGTGVRAAAGMDALQEAAHLPSDIVMAAIVGAAGLAPALTAIRRGAQIALANKECLVCAGDIVMKEVREYGATLIPVDSEHNALFQVFDFSRVSQVEHITLTASGGPFFGRSREDMQEVTPEEAIKHPRWDMGAKISVDSATLMNKGLELIEAYHLFPVREDQINIVVHPEAIIHGMVSYTDGSVLAQMGSPDMCTPISYALGWPERLPHRTAKLDLINLGTLSFFAPDEHAFPALGLARRALSQGATAPTILNAANEVAVARFLAHEIGFLDIARIVETALEKIPIAPISHLEDVIAADAEARRIAAELL